MSGIALASSALGLAGCGADALPGESLGSESQAIGGNWRAFVPTNKTLTGGFASDPAVCDAHADSGAWVAFGRAASNKIYMNFFQKTPENPQESGWLKQTDQLFKLKPACAVLDGLDLQPPNQRNYQKLIVAKSAAQATLDRYLYRIVKLAPPSPSTPVTIHDWSAIGTAAYVSAPAAGVVGSQLLVCGVRSDARLWCYRNNLDLTNPSAPLGTWQPGLQAPALPSPWTAVGDPAIADTTPWTSLGMIAIRATRTNPSQTSFFFTNWNGSSYSPWGPFPAPPSGVTIGSDPAMSVDLINSYGATLAFKSSTGVIYEGSGISSVGWSFSAINAAGGSNTGFSGTPAMAGNLDGWEGNNIVFARKNGQYQLASPCPAFGGC